MKVNLNTKTKYLKNFSLLYIRKSDNVQNTPELQS